MPLVNFRDIGGLKLADGKFLKKGVLYRAADLAFLKEEEISVFLNETKVDCYIDFSNNFEISKHSLIKKGVRYCNLFFDTTDPLFSSIKQPNSSDWAAFYVRISIKNINVIIQFLEILTNDTNQVFIYGCKAGKDRTGILTAILFSLLNIHQENILKDYSLTNVGLGNFHHYFHDEKTELGRTREEFTKHFLTVSPDIIDFFLKSIVFSYGSVEGFLLENGLNPIILKKLHGKFIE